MDQSEFAEAYDKICCNVRQTLKTYNDYKSSISQSQIDASINHLHKKQAKVNQNLDSSESNILANLGKWQSLKQWFTNIKQTNQEMQNKTEEEQYQLTKLRLAFASNASQLKSLEGDVIHCCRKLPDISESTDFLRLKSICAKSQEQYNQRNQVLSGISADYEIATNKLEAATQENENLTQLDSEFQKQLTMFNKPESFQLIQDARKHNIIEQDWAEKKQKIIKEIEDGQAELESYSGDKDQSYRNLILESNKQEQESNRLQLKYAEKIQDVINENSLSTANIATAMKQLMIDLERQEKVQLTKEMSITRSETRTLKNKVDHQISKFKTEVSNSSRSFIQSLSKLQDQKASTTTQTIVHNPRRIKKKKCKAKKKKTAVPETPVEPPPPPRVYTLFELADMKLNEEKLKYLELLRSKFDPEISELQSFLEKKIQIHQELLNTELSRIYDADKQQRELLTANYSRMQQKIQEKNIELSALNANIAAIDDMVRDYQKECDMYEKENNEYKKKSLEIAKTAKCIEIRKSVESLDAFLNFAKNYIDVITNKINETIETENTNKDKKLYNNRQLRRSNSTNNLTLSLALEKKNTRTTASALSSNIGEHEQSESSTDVKPIDSETASSISEPIEQFEEEMINEPEIVIEKEEIEDEIQLSDENYESGMELLRKSTNTLFETTMKDEEEEEEDEETLEKIEIAPEIIEKPKVDEPQTKILIQMNEIKNEIPVPKEIEKVNDVPINIVAPPPKVELTPTEKQPRHYLHLIEPPKLIVQQEDDNNIILPSPVSEKEFTIEAKIIPQSPHDLDIEPEKPNSAFLTHKNVLTSSTIHKQDEKDDNQIIDAAANVYQVMGKNRVGEMQMKKGVHKTSRNNHANRTGQKILFSVTPMNSQETDNEQVSNFGGSRVRNEKRINVIRTKERETKGARFMLYANDDNQEEKPFINDTRINRFFGTETKTSTSIRRRSIDSKEKSVKVHVSKKKTEKKQRAPSLNPSVRVFKKYK